MRLASFAVTTPTGTATRLGLDVGTDQLLDVNAAYAELVAGQCDPGRARHIADAVLPPDMLGFLANGDVASEALDALRAGEFEVDHNRFGQRMQYRVDEIALLAPLPRPRSIRDCSAFEEHVRNASGPRGVPGQWYRHPTYYKGNPSSVVGTGAAVRRPAAETRMDYELEFAVVIGTAGKDIPVEAAHRHVAGYMVFNDVSCRDIQLAEMRAFLGPAKGKDFDTGNVLGPYLVTPDEFDPTAPNAMVARVDGEEWSRGRTDSLYYSVSEIISYISRDESLHPGDVIGAGTVGGGCGLELGRYPAMGQEVELDISGLGVLRNRFVDARHSTRKESEWADSMAKSH
ncbi:fumarylacetoacetate hydrolase family protein [Mycobacterium avium]|uniref:fumarylacetoacetate hydrolase family protein n=1 Tax=Mycobacterium avium TaxID=1764 RepID=UPI001CC3AE13|nr:fumarylacetoacetate hydrolase family protein [Mycobacterium avium]MBZ4521787.1 fumarylacetoacetate hydrolase family protein [Mycobacterium avium subsp. hominissuis]MBZ4531201.1 fumarylacetoacetate hydrolase family protein [Mycobacterium avium subsp. hominissuis]